MTGSEGTCEKYMVLRTISLFVTFFSLGLSGAVLGPTIVSMEILLETDTKSISATFTGLAFGLLISSIVCGLIYSRVNKELLFTVCLIGIAASLACAPFSPHLVMFIASFVIVALFQGTIGTAAQPYLLKVWEGHKYKQLMMQSMHGIFSLGATTGPLIVRPFLAELTDPNNHNATCQLCHHNGSEICQLCHNSTTTHPEGGDISDDRVDDVASVRCAFIVLAAIISMSSILFLVTYVKLGPSCLDRSRKLLPNSGDKVKSTPRSTRFIITFLVLIFIYNFIYIWIECIPGNLLAVFVVKGLGWPNDHGAYVTSLYWGTFGLSRLVSIGVVLFLSPSSMLILDMIIVSVGFGLLFLVNLHASVVWISVTVFGLGMGSMFASGFLWAETYIEITGAAASVFTTASSLGAMSGPVLTGVLMDQYSYMWFAYILLGANVLMMIAFAGLNAYASKMGTAHRTRRRNHENIKLAEDKSLELLNDQVDFVSSKVDEETVALKCPVVPVSL